MATVKEKPLPTMEMTLEQKIDAEIKILSVEADELEQKKEDSDKRYDDQINRRLRQMELLRCVKEEIKRRVA